MAKPPRRSGPPRRPSKAGGPPRRDNAAGPQRRDDAGDRPRRGDLADKPRREDKRPPRRDGAAGPQRRDDAGGGPRREFSGSRPARPERTTPPKPAERPHRPGEPQRIAKLLARAGVASRRDVEKMIAEGRVAVEGKVIESPALNLPSLAGVTVDGQPIAAAGSTRIFRFHKPPGCLTTARDPKGRATIYDLLPKELPRLVTIGRLDMNTEGLLLLTNDGELKRWMELPANALPRRYRVRAFGSISTPELERLIDGITVEGVRYGPIDAEIEHRSGSNAWLAITLTEGKNREIRKVLEHLGLQVTRLIRVGYGPFDLGDMPVRAVDEVPPEMVRRLTERLKKK